ncbi:MAG: thiamine pyrophosphate-binding protein, partial [Proteobacteria bacterium]|nr:thiamine pyrophosphate-binding protein [Pseudomonadota bacterium]
AAAHMAEGYAMATGKPGVCVVTAGPGFTNSITGIANAHMANSPIVVISGKSPLSGFDTLPLQDLNQLDIVKPITKFARAVYRTERLAEYTAMAFRHCLSGRPGPAYIEVPIDVFFGMVEEDTIVYPRKYRVEEGPAGNPAVVEEAIDLLNAAERPVVVAGSGAFWSGADLALKDFVEKSGIPVFTRNNGRGTVPDDHPLSFGASALSGLFKADTALIVGTQLDFTLASGKFPPEMKMIRVDIDASALGHNRDVDVGIVGDAKIVLEQLTQGVKHQAREQWIESLTASQAKREEKRREFYESDNTPIHPLRLVSELKKHIDRDTIVTIDGGDISVFGGMTLPAYGPGTQLSNGNSTYGCLGVGLPFAVAAKRARPDKKVLSLIGDGSFGFNAMEFDTAIRHNLPFVCVISNDGCWGMIKHDMDGIVAEDRLVAVDLPNHDYHKLVEVLGGYGEKVEDPAEIGPAIERAFASGKPACVNVITDPRISPRKLKG